MRIPTTICACLVLVWTVLASGAAVASPNPALSRELRSLAARAGQRASWHALRQFGETARSAEERGLALFALGYREYEAGEYDSAMRDLRRAAENDFSLLDYALYFRAASARQAGEPGEVRAALEGFLTRFPHSTFRLSALQLLSSVLIEQGEAGKASEILVGEPQVRQRPALALLLARAYEATGRPIAAAGPYQDIYFAFPDSPEAKTAGSMLSQLRTDLGKDFPQVPIEIQTARAEILGRRRDSDGALKEYERLLRTYPQSPYAGRWEVGRARALMSLRRTTEAIQLLNKKLAASPEQDAWRLATLVGAYRRLEDEDGVVRTTEEIAREYPESPACASAWDEAGNYFVRQGDWGKAAVYYRKLADSFPRSGMAPEASWRVAWTAYLERDYSKAGELMAAFLRRYPDSSWVPAALYWLGRLAEERGDPGEARFLYQLLDQRFGNNFYAGQAAERLQKAPLRAATKVTPQNSSVAAVASGIPAPPAPTFSPCTAPQGIELAGRYKILEGLALDDLAEEALRREIEENPGRPEISLILARNLARQGRADVALFAAQQAAPDYPNYDFSMLPRDIWQVLYPQSYKTLVGRYARSHGLPVSLVMGLIRQESAFNPRATSPSNARGLMQVLPQTVSRRRAQRRVAARRLYEPAYNLRIGCAYLRDRLRAFDGKPELALASYHAGPTRVRRWLAAREFAEPTEFLETIPIPATRRYVERVLRDASIYRQIMDGASRFAECRPPSAPAGTE